MSNGKDKGNYIKATEKQVDALNINETQKKFLINFGIPKEASPRITSVKVAEFLRTIPELLPEIDFPADYSRYIVIAEDESTFICIDQKNSGEIFAIDPYQEIAPRFINSDVVKFVKSMEIYSELPSSKEAKSLPKDELKSRTENILMKIKDLDYEAFSDANNWWSVIFEELSIFYR